VNKSNTEIAKLMSDRYIHVAFVCVERGGGRLQIKNCMSFDDMNLNDASRSK
jgi:hypothetical protein